MTETLPRPDRATPPADAPGLGRSVVIGSAIGAVLCVGGVGAGMLAFGQVWQSSLGLGLFVAFWGGMGFGSMLGGVAWATRSEAAERDADARGDAPAPVTRPARADRAADG